MYIHQKFCCSKELIKNIFNFELWLWCITHLPCSIVLSLLREIRNIEYLIFSLNYGMGPHWPFWTIKLDQWPNTCAYPDQLRVRRTISAGFVWEIWFISDIKFCDSFRIIRTLYMTKFGFKLTWGKKFSNIVLQLLEAMVCRVGGETCICGGMWVGGPRKKLRKVWRRIEWWEDWFWHWSCWWWWGGSRVGRWDCWPWEQGWVEHQTRRRRWYWKRFLLWN